MKFFAVLVALVAVAVARPGPTVTHWSLEELSQAIQSPNTSPAILPYLEQTLNDLMDNVFAGSQQSSVAVHVDVTTWTLNQLSEAIQDPSTSAELLPYLEHALNQMMESLFAGQQLESIPVITPAGVIPAVPVPSPVIVPEIVVPEPVLVPEPVVVAPVAPEAASSPLVQIIVNVNAQQQAPVNPGPAIIPEPVVPAPTPVHVVDTAPIEDIIPEPVEVVETAPIPEPVIVVELPQPEPEPVIVVEPPTNPIDVIAINPPTNPIDVVAVAPPEFNPVDVISPIVVPPVGVAIDAVGPMV